MTFFEQASLRLFPGLLSLGETLAVLPLALLLAGSALMPESQDLAPADISRAVERAFHVDPVLEGADLFAITQNGALTLGGHVSSVAASERAERMAETVRGVRAVDNRIAVRPPVIADEELAADVAQTLAGTPFAQVRVQVESGRVVLNGAMPSLAARRYARDEIAHLRGVALIEDRTTITNTPRQDLAVAVKQALRLDALVADGAIEVDANGSTVTLTGMVRSAAEERRAREVAGSAGVRHVNVSNLRVVPGVEASLVSSGKYHQRSSLALARGVRAALDREQALSQSRISVKIDKARAILTGKTDTVYAQRLAEQCASHVLGISRVVNLLELESSAVSDKELAPQVRAALDRDALLDAGAIGVQVRKRVLTLRGKVTSTFARQRAEARAARVAGVRSVVNLLSVAAPGTSGFGLYLNEDVERDGHGMQPRTASGDGVIAATIEMQLAWSALVDADDIAVSVHRGVTTLTGSVASPLQARVATDHALAGGGFPVKNLLAVQ